MGRKTILQPVTIIDAATIDEDVSSAAINVLQLDAVSVQFVWSAGTSPVGTVQVQGRIDGLTWENLLPVALNVSGASGSHFVALDTLLVEEIRVVYDFGSGTATANCHVMGKAVGA